MLSQMNDMENDSAVNFARVDANFALIPASSISSTTIKIRDKELEMRQRLARQGRGLTAEQWGCVTASLDQATARYCRLAMRVVSKWTSTTPA